MTATATRPIAKPDQYVHDGQRLLYVISGGGGKRYLLEDCWTGNEETISAVELRKLTIVERETEV